MSEEPIKLDISQTQQRELKLYYFITKEAVPNTTPLLVKEGVVSVVSYDLDQAVQVANQGVKPGTGLVIGGNQSVKSILDIIKTEKEKPEEKKAMAFENFKSAILYAAEEYVTSKADKLMLQTILKRLTVKK